MPQVSGAAVLARASGVKVVFIRGKCFVRRVVRKRSSPRCSRFFLCKVSTLLSAYSLIISGEIRYGLPLNLPRSFVFKRYNEKQPGRQVTVPNKLSNAFASA